jgi:hypothetical protein
MAPHELICAHFGLGSYTWESHVTVRHGFEGFNILPAVDMPLIFGHGLGVEGLCWGQDV